MIDTFNALGSAIYARMGTVVYTYNTNGTVTTSGTLGCYDGQAPQGTNPPYVIFQFGAGGDEYKFSGDHGESQDYILKVVSDRYYPSAQAQGIYAQAHNELQDAPLSVSGNTLLRCRRTTRLKYQDSDRYWHVGGFYRIDTWGT